MKTITDANYESTVANAKGLILLDFWASWCGQCKMIDVAISNLADEIKDEATILRVDTDAAPSLVKRFDIKGLPTFVLIEDNQEKARAKGAVSTSSLKNLISAYVKN